MLWPWTAFSRQKRDCSSFCRRSRCVEGEGSGLTVARLHRLALVVCCEAVSVCRGHSGGARALMASKGTAKRIVTSSGNGSAIVVASGVQPAQQSGRLVMSGDAGYCPQTRTNPSHARPHSAPWAPTLARARRAATAAAFFWRAASYCFGREVPGQSRPTQRTPRNAGQGRLVPRRGRAPAARDRGPRHAQVVRPRGAPAGPHGQAVPGAVAQPAEPRHQQAALDGRRGQGHPAELRAVRRALGRHRPGPAGAHGQRRQEPLELFDAAEDRAVRV